MKQLSLVDLAWLRMDDPDNLMIITGIMTFSQPLEAERLKAIVAEHMLRFDRFRQRVVKPVLPFRRPYWEDDPNFDLEAHVKVIQLPEPADREVLMAFVSRLMSVGLDPARPLWKFYVVENYAGGSALIGRLHHAIADGIALVQVILSMTETSPDTLVPELDVAPALRRQAWLEKQLKEAQQHRERDFDQSLAWFEDGVRLLADRDTRRRYLQVGARTAAAAGKLVLRWPDPQTIFKGPLGREKRAALSDPLALEDVKRIGRALDGTVNDVLLTAVTGALRRYMQANGALDDAEANIRSFIPVNLRPIETGYQLGNRFGLVFLTMPILAADPLERLRLLRQNMDELKSSAEAIAAYGLLTIIGAIPYGLQQVAISIFDAKGSAIMTNVPGPRVQLYLAGAPVDTIMAWVPQSGRIGLGVSIISYNGRVYVGVASDAGLVPDPERILAFFVQEFEVLLDLAEHPPAPPSVQARSRKMSAALADLEHVLSDLDRVLEERSPGS